MSIKIDNEKIHQALQLFVSKDDFRVMLTKPFIAYRHVIATDATALLWTDKLPWDGYEHWVDKCPSTIKDLIEPTISYNKVISTEQLQYAYQSLKLIPEEVEEIIKKECPECDLNGKVQWEYSHHEKMGDCPICDGTKEVEVTIEKLTGRMVPEENQIIMFGSKALSGEQIFRLLELVKLLQLTNINFCTDTPENQGCYFDLGVLKLIIMPMQISEEYTKIIYKIT